jgi:hypothetical protein
LTTMMFGRSVMHGFHHGALCCMTTNAMLATVVRILG